MLTPETRKENFLARIAGDPGKVLEPHDREEWFLQRIIDTGGGGGGGGSSLEAFNRAIINGNGETFAPVGTALVCEKETSLSVTVGNPGGTGCTDGSAASVAKRQLRLTTRTVSPCRFVSVSPS